MIRKFIHLCEMQRGKDLLLIEEGFEYICMFSGVIGAWKQRFVQDTCKLQLSVMDTFPPCQ